MKQAIRRAVRPFLAVLALAVVAIAVAVYILGKQRLRIPLIQAAPIHMQADLSTAKGVTPGQGQPVQVSGVNVGLIDGVTLVNGFARLDLEIYPQFAGVIRTGAHAFLRPRTGLDDMYLQVFPGAGAAARDGFRIPIANTLTPVDLDQILASIDRRTRDYVMLLANGAGEGLRGRGTELAQVFERFEPTARDLRLVAGAVAREREAASGLVTSLARLDGRLARRPRDLTQLVGAASSTFGAFASEDRSLRDTVQELPATLRRATITLRKVKPLADELRPATRALTPALRALGRADVAATPFARAALPHVRDQLRPFAREARPLVRDLRPAARQLAATAPELTRVTTVVNHLLNMFAFNPRGREGPTVPNREEGYLFWLAWAFHDTVNLFNVDDANGGMRPVYVTGTCSTLTSLVTYEPALEFGLNLSPLLATACGNPQTPSIDIQQAINQILGLLPASQARAEGRTLAKEKAR